MKNYSQLRYLIHRLRKYIFIFFITIIFFLSVYSTSFSQENVFVVDDVKVEGKIDINFSREKFIRRAFLDSFSMLKSRILLSKDLNKINQMKLHDI